MAPQPVAKRMFGEKPGKDWYVQCKHPDNSDEVVQVKQLTTHRPRDVNDFEKGEKYEIESTKWTKGHRCFYRVYIGRIASKRAFVCLRYHYLRLVLLSKPNVGFVFLQKRRKNSTHRSKPKDVTGQS